MAFRRDRIMGDAVIRYLQHLEEEEREGMAILTRKGQMLQVRTPLIFTIHIYNTPQFIVEHIIREYGQELSAQDVQYRC